MLFGRFLFIIPALAVAGSLASKKRVPTSARHAADARRAVRRPARGHGDRRRRADVLPGALARPDRRALPDAPGHSCSRRCSCRSRSGVKSWLQPLTAASAPRPVAPSPVDEIEPDAEEARAGAAAVRSGDPAPRAEGFGPEAESRDADEEPGDLRRRGRRGAGRCCSSFATSSTGARRHRLRAADRPLALVHGAVRDLRRGDGRGARQGAGRIAAQDEDRHDRRTASADGGRIEKVLVVEAARRRRRRLRARAR